MLYPRMLLLSALAALCLLTIACGGDDDDGGGGLATNYPDAGEDVFESTRATVKIEYAPESVSVMPGQGLETIELEGPTTVTRSDPTDADGDGRAEVNTEIVAMELRGTASFGDFIVALNPDKESKGMVEQQEAGEDFPADSYFDVWVQVELPASSSFLPRSGPGSDLVQAGQNSVLAVTTEPLRMEAELSDLPPGEGDEYRVGGDGEPVPLVAVNDATLRLGQIVDALHIPNPEGGATDEPTEEPTEEPEDTGTPAPTATTGVPTVETTQELGCEHTQPGVQSDLLDLIFAFLVAVEELSDTDPGAGEMVLQVVSADGRVLAGPADSPGLLKEPLAGAKVTATAAGPGVLEADQSATTGDDGSARIRFPINQFGTYMVTVGSVQAADGTLYAFRPGSVHTADYTVQATCTTPDGF